MKPSTLVSRLAVIRVMAAGVLLVALSASLALGTSVKPYRVALVIGDQWDDPASFLVTPRSAMPTGAWGESYISEDFSSLVIMLKSWGIPFDIIRLDQEFMDINRFLGPDGKPEVGCIIWDADIGPGGSDKLQPQRLEVLREAVADYGISLIALADRIKDPILQELLGLKYIGSWLSNKDLNLVGTHFITSGLRDPLDYTDNPVAYKKRVQVKVVDAQTIVKQGKYPQVTVRELPSGAKVVWFGGDAGRMFSYQECRTLLRRAITWSIGYSLFKTWENTAWLIMDDPGGAQNSWLEHWHYHTLTEGEMEKYLIKPLQKHNGILVINVVPGFVNDELKRVEPSFQRKFTDEFGTLQDYPSTKRGLIKGMKLGVFELQSHGLTHMQPDLWSPPGPWFGSPLDQERAEVGWYREFGDTRRNKEIPAAEAFWRMKTSKKWFKYHFGITPLSFVQGGGGISLSYINNTWRLAAKAGFGWYCWSGGYLGPDMAVHGWDFGGTMESPLTVQAPPDAHDKGIAEHPKQFLRAFKEHPNVRWIGINEFVGYTHAGLSGGPEAGNLTIRVDYDPHYCRYFEKKKSEWNLLVADWLAKSLGKPSVKVDGKTVVRKADLSKQLKVKIPAGVGKHSIQIR